MPSQGPNPSEADARAQNKRWLDNWRRVGPILEAERWERLRSMTDEEAQKAARDVQDLWQPDWVGDAGEELLSDLLRPFETALEKAARS